MPKFRDSKEILISWKEIAGHLGCGVRTAQRWEIEFGLPVHRPHGMTRGAVIAMRSELNLWVTSFPSEIRRRDLHKESLIKSSIEEQIRDSQRLRAEVRESRRQLNDMVMRIHQTLRSIQVDISH